MFFEQAPRYPERFGLVFLRVDDEAAMQDVAGAFCLREQSGDRACRARLSGYDSDSRRFERIESLLRVCLEAFVCFWNRVWHVALLSGFLRNAFRPGCLVFFAPPQMRLELCKIFCIEHAIFRHGPLAGHQYAPLDVVDFFGRVGIGIDAEHAPQLQPAGAPTPVEIETPWVGVDLDGDAVLGAGFKNLFHIDFVTGTS